MSGILIKKVLPMKCITPSICILMVFFFSSLYTTSIPLQEDWHQTFTSVFTTLKKESYLPTINRPSMIKALNAFVHSIDEHSSVLEPEEYKELIHTTSGGLFRTGITLGPKKPTDDFLMILKVEKGSPASRAGIQRYDKIKAIDSLPVISSSLEDNIARLSGAHCSSTVTLLIAREHQENFSCTINRSFIPKKVCCGYFLPHHSILYCALTLFTQQTSIQLETLLRHAHEKKVKGIIIDLRNNGGGLLKAALECTALFVDKGSLIVSTKNLHGSPLVQYRTERDPLSVTVPIILLVNQHTASSAEIFAQSLKLSAQKKNQKTFVSIVGTPTRGKGSIQEIKQINENCALKITTARYYMADGSSLHNKGIIPDFIIKEYEKLSPEVQRIQELFQEKKTSQRSFSLQKKKTAPEFEKKPAHKETLLKNDPQCACACTLITLFSHAKTHTPYLVGSYRTTLSWLQSHYVVPTDLILIKTG